LEFTGGARELSLFYQPPTKKLNMRFIHLLIRSRTKDTTFVAFLLSRPRPHGCCNHKLESRHGLGPRAVSRGWTVTVPRLPALPCSSLHILSASRIPAASGEKSANTGLSLLGRRQGNPHGCSCSPACHLNVSASHAQTKRESGVPGSWRETPQPDLHDRRRDLHCRLNCLLTFD
jgi:hypothetical protein